MKKFNIPIKPRGGRSSAINIKGQKFGKLTAISHLKIAGDSAIWQCRCKCGNVITTKSIYLRKGYTKSCGKCTNHHCWKGYKEISGWYFGTIRQRASKKGIKFNLDIKYLWNLYTRQHKKCALTNLDIFFVRNMTNDCVSAKTQTASLDRIDSSKGYIRGNVQWVHKDVNRMKWDLTQKRFIEICELVYKNYNE